MFRRSFGAKPLVKFCVVSFAAKILESYCSNTGTGNQGTYRSSQGKHGLLNRATHPVEGLSTRLTDDRGTVLPCLEPLESRGLVVCDRRAMHRLWILLFLEGREKPYPTRTT